MPDFDFEILMIIAMLLFITRQSRGEKIKVELCHFDLFIVVVI